MQKADRLFQLACEIVSTQSDFQRVRGPGEGDAHTLGFMRALRQAVEREIGPGTHEQRICGETSFKVDFYFRDESTIVEVALGLPNPNTEFEKDILKAIIAQDLGYPVRRLLLISRPGAAAKCSQPGRMAVRKLVEQKHGLTVDVTDLPGEPRVRVRRRRAATS